MSDAPRTKITYATLRADNEELHAAFEAAVVAARARLGGGHPNIIGGRERDGDGEFELRSPIDQDILVGRFAKASRQDVQDAIAAALDSQLKLRSWAKRGTSRIKASGGWSSVTPAVHWLSAPNGTGTSLPRSGPSPSCSPSARRSSTRCSRSARRVIRGASRSGCSGPR